MNPMPTPMPEDLAGLDAELDQAAAVRPCECPACLAHPGRPCNAVAGWKTMLHDVHNCNAPDLLNGAAVRLLCAQCLAHHRVRADELAKRARMVYVKTNGILCCKTCQRPLLSTDAFLEVEEFHGL